MTNFYTPGIYALESGGWAYAPWGDIYALTPLWSDAHGLTGETINVEDEVNRYAIVAQYDAPDGIDPFFILTVTEDDPLTKKVIEEDIPTGTPAISTRIWRSYGFNDERNLTVSKITELNDLDAEVWTGKFKVSFPPNIRRWVGAGGIAKFSLDFWTTETPETRVRLAFGTVVFRK